MRVAGEIGEHALRSTERRLGVDDEGAFAQRTSALGESAGVCERGQIAKEAKSRLDGRLLPGLRGRSRRNVLDSAWTDKRKAPELGAGDPVLRLSRGRPADHLHYQRH